MAGENNGLILRINELIIDSGMKKSKFASECEIDPSNFSKKLDGSIKFTELDIHKIASHLNVRWEWLVTGEGEKMKDNGKSSTSTNEETTSHDQMLALAMKLASKENECKMLKEMYERAMADRERIITEIIELSNKK